MQTIYYVTGNPGKIATANRVLKGLDYNVTMYKHEFVEPDINDIEYIAIWKVKEAYKMLGEPCIALDSGFYIPAYPDEENFPGAFVERKLVHGIGMDGLLEKMKDVIDRYCYFKECLAYFDGKEIKLFYGYDEGYLVKEISPINKEEQWSPLWKVYISKGTDKVLAELTSIERANRPYTTSSFNEFKKYLETKKETKILVPKL